MNAFCRHYILYNINSSSKCAEKMFSLEKISVLLMEHHFCNIITFYKIVLSYSLGKLSLAQSCLLWNLLNWSFSFELCNQFQRNFKGTLAGELQRKPLHIKTKSYLLYIVKHKFSLPVFTACHPTVNAVLVWMM